MNNGYCGAIPRSGYYITLTGKKVILKSKDIINVSHMYLTELIIPDGVRVVHCVNNKLTKLILPDSIKSVYSSNNKLTKLDLPDSVEYIDCRYNNLTELICPDNCIVIRDPYVNIITKTMFNRSKRLKYLLSK